MMNYLITINESTDLGDAANLLWDLCLDSNDKIKVSKSDFDVILSRIKIEKNNFNDLLSNLNLFDENLYSCLSGYSKSDSSQIYFLSEVQDLYNDLNRKQ